MSVPKIANISKRAWSRWSEQAQDVFNKVYNTSINNQHLFLHPKQEPIVAEHWETTCHNMAWFAADAVDELDREYV